MLDAENPADDSTTATPEAESPDTAAAERTEDAGRTQATDQPPEAGAPVAGAPAKKTAAKRATKKTATKKTPAKKSTAKRTTKKAAAADAGAEEAPGTEDVPGTAPTGGAADPAAGSGEPAESDGAATPRKRAATKRATKKTAKKAPAKRTAKKAAADSAPETAPESSPEAALDEAAAPVTPTPEAAGQAADAASSAEAAPEPDSADAGSGSAAGPAATALLFQPPDPTKAVTRRRRGTKAAEPTEPAPEAKAEAKPEASAEAAEPGEKPKKKTAKKGSGKNKGDRDDQGDQDREAKAAGDGADARGQADEGDEEQGGGGRRRRRGGRRRRRGGGGDADTGENGEANDKRDDGQRDNSQRDNGKADSDEGEESGGGSRRRRRRRRSGETSDGSADDPETTVTKVRKPRSAEDEITALTGSTRLEAKKQRRREGREAGRRRAPIVSEAEFLARRESVDRVMVIRQREDLTQIAVLEDKVLVEHYVSRESQTSLIGNVYLGRVQNVLPSMEAAFIDIGKGRNAVLYAGEVNWDALGAKNGAPRKIESVLKSGQPILVQVTKDPVGHKGARLTSQISLPGRFLVYVPDGNTSGISRKLPDTERNRLKSLLKEIVPESAGVIVRTAAEGASEEELTRDVERLTARWEDIESKVKGGNAPQMLYGEPDLTLKVVRDLFTEDFNKLVIAGDDAWDMVDGYVSHVAPDLSDRLERYDGDRDVFAAYRIDEQIEKALDRKVWLPSGGSLVIDRTEAMTVVDVNTGKFTGSGGNLEETVTKNNLEAAEEIVRQLRLRDIGGIIVVDFIDMVLESNRDLVLRRLVECLGRDRTRHQVAEVTSLGLVQMTRKRIGTGLLEAFSESCEHCQGRGLMLHPEPIEPKKKVEDDSRRGRRGGRGRGRDESQSGGNGNGNGVPSPKDVAAMAKPEDGSAADQQKASGNGKAAAAEPQAPPADEKPGRAQRGRRGTPAEPTRSQAGEPDGPQAASPPPAAPAAPEADGSSRRAESAVPAESAAPVEGAGSAESGAPAESPERAESAEPDRPVVKKTTRSRRVRATRAAAAPEVPAQPDTATPSGAEASPSAESPESTRSAASEPDSPVDGEPAQPTQGLDEPSAQAGPAPAVVTSVRRRSARRAAGPPQAASAGSATSTATLDPMGQQASDDVTDDVADEPADAEPLATLLDSAEVGEESSDEAAEAPEESSATPHVPVKRKGGSRRR